MAQKPQTSSSSKLAKAPKKLGPITMQTPRARTRRRNAVSSTPSKNAVLIIRDPGREPSATTNKKIDGEGVFELLGYGASIADTEEEDPKGLIAGNLSSDRCLPL
ncbi:hypothetical protein GH714_038935 [Hevea brasiliensis]|uniref:Uncharacterized protein n=1 Tax=Hevea brasiliensis TaxID=3981 RepID=A0A6A6K8P9_HEVBR|nr:hypothetical protein GH714_038935 [Hevea brasiliensis]